MLNIEKITSLEQLSGDQREIAETVGLEAYKNLVERFGGCQLYIQKSETISKEIRNQEIKKVLAEIIIVNLQKNIIFQW